MQKTSDIIWQDSQHQKLFQILDQIKSPGDIRDVLRQLEDYTDYHFALEEQYMAELQYPGLEAHVKAHNIFRKEITQAVEGGDPDPVFRDIIATFLTEWLTRHVLGIDKQLEDYIMRSDVK